MKRSCLLDAVCATSLCLLINSAQAAVTSIDPDAFPAGTDISNAFSGVTLSASGAQVSGAVFSNSHSHASTGRHVFGSPGTGWGSSPGITFRIDFASHTDFVSIDVIPNDSSDSATLRVFDDVGNLLTSFTTTGTAGAYVPENASVTWGAADIAYATVYSGSDNYLLDNLQYNSGHITLEVPGGTSQECTSIGGSNVMMTGNVSLLDPNEIVAITWYLDGDSTPIASGETVEFFVPFGTHSVEAVVSTVTLGTGSDTESITIEDTIAPEINPAFLSSKNGEVITSIDHKGKVEISEGVVDICDPAPITTAVAGLPTQEGDTLSVKGNNKDASISVTSGPNTSEVTLMVTAEDASGNVSSESTVLTVTP